MAISVAPTRIKTVLKQELRLSYRRTRTTPPQANAQRCLVLRQQYALAIMPLLERRSRILNADETWLSESTFEFVIIISTHIIVASRGPFTQA